MPLPSKWNSKDDVPEALKPYVVERDGKAVLDVVGMQPKEIVDEFRENNLRLQGELEKLHGKLSGALSAEEAQRLQAELETLRTRLESGAADEKVNEILSKRLVPVKIGDREVSVDRTSKPVLEASLRDLSGRLDQSMGERDKLATELRKEKIVGGGQRAAMAIPGVKQAAIDDIVRHLSDVFVLSEDLSPFMPDPEMKDGKTPRIGKDGKPTTMESYLLEVKESGRKTGVWFDEPKGPGRTPSGARETAGGSAMVGVSRIRRGLERSEQLSR